MIIVKGENVAIAVGTGGAIVAAFYFIWRKFRPRGVPTSVQWDIFAEMGDVNRDGHINSTDSKLVEAAFNAIPGSPDWNPAYDLNKDLVINLRDEYIIIANDRLNIWDYFGL